MCACVYRAEKENDNASVENISNWAISVKDIWGFLV